MTFIHLSVTEGPATLNTEWVAMKVMMVMVMVMVTVMDCFNVTFQDKIAQLGPQTHWLLWTWTMDIVIVIGSIA